MTGPEPQGVLNPLTEAAIFLVVTIRDGAEHTVHDLLPDITGLVRAVGTRRPEDDLSCVVGIGAEAYGRLFDATPPVDLHPFREVRGEVHTAPSTPGDLLFHLRARRMDLCFELAGHLMDRLTGSVEVADEVHGFRFFDERDLLGFVDGTENPRGAAAADAVLIRDDRDHAGGTFVVVQRYQHDLDAWNALTVEQQERAIGRHKLSDVEIPDDDKAPDSHVALTVIEDDDGTQRQIVRDNMPFGSFTDRDFGTYFIGYAAHPEVIEEMLRNMFVGKPPGTHDRILDFSTPRTGSLFFVPTIDFLDDPPGLASAAAAGARA